MTTDDDTDETDETDEPRFALLGPVRAWRGDTEIPLGSGQQRAVLAVLLLRGNTHTSVGGLVDALWDEPPRSAEQVIRTYVYRLRRILQPSGSSQPVIRSVGSGYVVATGPRTSDVAAFRQAMAEAERVRRAGDAAAAAAHLRAGLALWHGDALTDVPGPYAEAQREALHRMRHTATEHLLAAEVDLGASGDTVAQITGLLDQNPLNERLRELLMLALYRRGEQAGALDVYRQGVDVLSAELGIDPGPGLRAMFDRILRADPGLLLPPASRPAEPTGPAAPPRPGPVVSAQLPAALPTFAGRAEDVARLESLLVPDAAHPTPALAVVSGMAGVGKTTLAVHWAHRVAPHYPDGALYIRLHGFDVNGVATPTGEAIGTVLQAFGVPNDRIPLDIDAKTALYRSVLATRRVLLLLDDAQDAEQVRPLLPGGPGSLVIVTSRNRLTGLVALDGARSVRLDPLDTATANDVLVARLGAERVAAEPDAVAELIRQCAGLPLALAVIATRAITHSSFTLGDLAAELRTLRAALDAFDDDEAALNLRAVFSCSYRALGADAARLFRLLAEHADPEFGPAGAAAALAMPIERVRPVLDELTRTELVMERAPRRYTYHDLLRSYAMELSAEQDSPVDRAAARHRFFDYLLYSGWSATSQLYPNTDLGDPPLQMPAGTERFTDKPTALTWMSRQHPVIRSAVAAAERAGEDGYVCSLARVISGFLQRQDLWEDQLTVQGKAVEAARRSGDEAARARAHRTMGNTYSRLGRHGDAIKHFATAHDLLVELGDRRGLGQLHRGLAAAWGNQNRFDIALTQSREAHDHYVLASDTGGRAAALNDIGWCLAQLRRHDEGMTACREALTLFQDLGNDDGAASAWHSIGYIHLDLGEAAEAARCFARSIELFTLLGDLPSLALALTHLGEAEDAAGSVEAANDAYRSAIAIYDRLTPNQADRLRQRLLDRSPDAGRTRPAGG